MRHRDHRLDSHLLLVLDESRELRPLDLHRLIRAIVQGNDEVEEVGLAKVGGRVLLEVGPIDGRTVSTDSDCDGLRR